MTVLPMADSFGVPGVTLFGALHSASKRKSKKEREKEKEEEKEKEIQILIETD